MGIGVNPRIQLRTVPVVRIAPISNRDAGVTLRIAKDDWHEFSLSTADARNLAHALVEAAERSEHENFVNFPGNA